jgi:hypothetical protein
MGYGEPMRSCYSATYPSGSIRSPLKLGESGDITSMKIVGVQPSFWAV